ncbi:unnamed protein product [Durusdinium trenchii]|uniref:Uncharacterized protein n=1 Tax=Durusdinium trenchii TaxID=1381693 RepID=A0ABP0K9V1_9DINO
MPQKLAHLSSELCRTEVRKRWVFICGPIMCFLAMTHQQISCQALCGTQISMAPARLVEDTRLVMRAKAVGGPKRKDSKKQAQVQKERKKRDAGHKYSQVVTVHTRVQVEKGFISERKHRRSFIVVPLKDDVIELEGTVVVHSRNVFKVLLSNGAEVQCTLAGKLRMNNIKGAQFHTLVLDGAGG